MKLEHVRRGSGPPLLLIHGIGGEWRGWDPLMDRLAEERELVAVDLPGFGGSPPLPPGRAPGAPEFARAIAEFLREEVGSEPVEVAGHSLGGWTALELAKLGAASRVTAIAPAGFWTPREAAFTRWSLWLTVRVSRHGSEMFEWALRSSVVRRALLVQVFGHPERMAAAQVQPLSEAVRKSARFDETNVTMTNDRFRNDPRIDVPVTILWGTRDALLLPRQAARAARETGGEVVMVDGGGHFVHWEDPETALRLLLRA